MSRRLKGASVLEVPVWLSMDLSEATIEGWPGGGVRGRRPTEPVAHEPARGLMPLVIVRDSGGGGLGAVWALQGVDDSAFLAQV